MHERETPASRRAFGLATLTAVEGSEVAGGMSHRGISHRLSERPPGWQGACLCGWHLGSGEGTPLRFVEELRKVKILTGRGKSLILEPLLMTLDEAPAESPKCTLTAVGRLLVPQGRDGDGQYLAKWLLVKTTPLITVQTEESR